MTSLNDILGYSKDTKKSHTIQKQFWPRWWWHLPGVCLPSWYIGQTQHSLWKSPQHGPIPQRQWTSVWSRDWTWWRRREDVWWRQGGAGLGLVPGLGLRGLVRPVADQGGGQALWCQGGDTGHSGILVSSHWACCTFCCWWVKILTCTMLNSNSVQKSLKL